MCAASALLTARRVRQRQWRGSACRCRGKPAGKEVTVGLVAPSSGVYGLYGPVLSGMMKGVFGHDGAPSGIKFLTEDDAR